MPKNLFKNNKTVEPGEQPRAIMLMKILHRRPLYHMNRFQRRLLFSVLVSYLLGFAICLLALDYFYFDESALIFDFTWAHFKLLAKWFLPLAAFSLFVVGVFIYYITHRILGPYVRIIREMDEVIEGRHRKILTVRRKDEMFADLLKRINALIKKIPG